MESSLDRLPAGWRANLLSLDRRLRQIGRPARAVSEKAYLKSSHEFYGVDIPTLQRETRAFLRDHNEAGRQELVRAARALWTSNVHEHLTVGLLLLGFSVRKLGPADLPFMKTLARKGAWWNYVDYLATEIVAPIIERNPDRSRDLGHWSRDSNLWVRRAALLGLMPGVRHGTISFKFLARQLEPRLSEQEFFMRKAIGWILREVGKDDPASVGRFLEEHLERLSTLTFREAIKYLPRSDRSRLTRARQQLA